MKTCKSVHFSDTAKVYKTVACLCLSDVYDRVTILTEHISGRNWKINMTERAKEMLLSWVSKDSL